MRLVEIFDDRQRFEQDRSFAVDQSRKRLEVCSASTRVTTCTLPLSVFRDTLSEGFSHFVTSIAAPVASGGSGWRVGFARTGKRRPFHDARQNQTCECSLPTCAAPITMMSYRPSQSIRVPALNAAAPRRKSALP